VAVTIVVLVTAACSDSGDYADSSSQTSAAESTVLPTIVSQPEERIIETDATQPTPSTIEDPAEEPAPQDSLPNPTDDEVERANRWNGYDLDCADLTITDIPITGSDPNGLDREGDGVGCES
jgi:hypothetical protein